MTGQRAKKLVTTLNVGIDRPVHKHILISIPPVRNYKKKYLISKPGTQTNRHIETVLLSTPNIRDNNLRHNMYEANM